MDITEKELSLFFIIWILYESNLAFAFLYLLYAASCLFAGIPSFF